MSGRERANLKLGADPWVAAVANQMKFAPAQAADAARTLTRFYVEGP